VSRDTQPESELSKSALSSKLARGPEVLGVSQWAEFDWLRHGFSTRRGNGLNIASDGQNTREFNLGYTAEERPEVVLHNRRLLLEAVSPLPALDGSDSQCSLVTLRQMHSALVRRAGKADATERASMWGDGLISDEPGVFLGIQTADCLPVLMADTRHHAVAAYHAGWRGTLKGIVERGVESMRVEFGSKPKDLTAAIGPGIGSCCFFVGSEVRDLFRARFAYADELFTAAESGLRLDLVEANRRQLLDAGLSPEKIFALNECTSCQTDRFFSYRAERGKTGRMMAVIGIAAE
jgi:polyphenol oxidase